MRPLPMDYYFKLHAQGMTQPPPSVYLAGPFFNSRELAVIQAIEVMANTAGLNFHSPRMNGGPNTAEDRRRLFTLNMQQIQASTFMLAWVDRLCSRENQTLRICTEVKGAAKLCSKCEITDCFPNDECPKCGQLLLPTKGNAYSIDSPPINQPDIGTVYEVGVAKGYRMGCFLYTEQPKGRLNVMLAEGADGVIYGRQALSNFLKWVRGYHPQCLDYVSEWKGENSETDFSERSSGLDPVGQGDGEQARVDD